MCGKSQPDKKKDAAEYILIAFLIKSVVRLLFGLLL